MMLRRRNCRAGHESNDDRNRDNALLLWGFGAPSTASVACHANAFATVIESYRPRINELFRTRQQVFHQRSGSARRPPLGERRACRGVLTRRIMRPGSSVIDEDGEDYLHPADWFVAVEVPKAVQASPLEAY